MKHLAITLLLLTGLATSHAQLLRLFSLGNPLEERVEGGPLLEELIRPNGEVAHTRRFDARGLLVWEDAGGTGIRFGPTAVIASVDPHARTVAFTGLIPEHMDVGAIRTTITYSGSVDREDRTRFKTSGSSPVTGLEPGMTVKVGVRLPYTSSFTYSPNKVVEERAWEDGTPFETYTYEYGRHGLTLIERHDHQAGTTTRVACLEYDERGNLIVEQDFCFLGVSPTRYRYDEENRLVAIRIDSQTITISYAQPTQHVSEIKIQSDYATTNVTYDRHAKTIAFSTYDQLGINPTSSQYLDPVLRHLGFEAPRASGASSPSGLASGRIHLDSAGRIIEFRGLAEPSEVYTRHTTVSIDRDRDGRWTSITETHRYETDTDNQQLPGAITRTWTRATRSLED